MRRDDVSNIEIVNDITKDGSCDIADKTNATTKLTEPKIAMLNERNSDSQQIEQENPLKDWTPEPFLQQKQRNLLHTGEPLDDAVINAAQRLLQQQFPQIKGLRPTVYSQAVHKFQEVPEVSESIQIHHTRAFHWDQHYYWTTSMCSDPYHGQ